MTALLRRRLPLLAALALPVRAAQALEERAATQFLFSHTADGGRGEMACSAFKAWGPDADGIFVVVVPDGQDIRVALMRAGEDGAPQVVAGPVTVEPLTIDPLWSCLIDIDDLAPLGGQRVIAVRLSNSYTSTGRSTSNEALHLVVRDGTALRPIFASLLRAAHSETGPRGQRTGWERRWRVVPVGGRPGGMPDLVVRDVRNNAAVSRHRWTGEAYVPPVYDRTPPLGQG